jgi:RNA 2',3'-cyclic 3'-phosphodiesterase
MPTKSQARSDRCFIGIKFPLLQQIGPIVKVLTAHAADSQLQLRISPPRNLHLTLKFLGAIDAEQRAELAAVLGDVSNSRRGFKIDCKGVGFFKDSLWLGITPNEELSNLVSALNQAVTTLGIQSENKPFTPHITIARFAAVAKPKMQTLMAPFENAHWGEIAANKFHLYRSETLPEGAMYYITSKYELNEN